LGAFAVAVMLAGGPSFSQEPGQKGPLVVIVNITNPINQLSAEELEKIYLGKRGFWEWGKPIKMVDLVEEDMNENKSARAIFSAMYMDKSLPALKSYWIRAIFSGKGQPPLVFGRREDVVNYVSQNMEAIGYVRMGELGADNVKSITILMDNKP